MSPALSVNPKAAGLSPERLGRIRAGMEIAGVAAMMLFKEGEVALADPISNFIPEFGQMQVAMESSRKLTGTVPAARPIAMLDLMRHTTGLNYTGPRGNGGLVCDTLLNRAAFSLCRSLA